MKSHQSLTSWLSRSCVEELGACWRIYFDWSLKMSLSYSIVNLSLKLFPYIIYCMLSTYTKFYKKTKAFVNILANTKMNDVFPILLCLECYLRFLEKNKTRSCSAPLSLISILSMKPTQKGKHDSRIILRARHPGDRISRERERERETPPLSSAPRPKTTPISEKEKQQTSRLIRKKSHF